MKISGADDLKKKQSFLYGAALLAASSILCKIMSAAMKIPLDRFFLHEEGIGIYQSAYSIYNVFLAFCVTGIPIALSSLIAPENEEKSAALEKSANVLVTAFCAVGAVCLFFFARPIAVLLSGGGKPEAYLSLRILSPALLVLGTVSSKRGYFQGKRNMLPSALSQIAESLAKVVFGILICAFAVKKGAAYGAFGAMCGVSIGAAASALCLAAFYRKNVKIKCRASFEDAKKVLFLSFPMTLGAFGFTGVMLADSLTVGKILAQSGVTVNERLKLFGYLTRANTVYNLPATVITAFAASAVPAISFAFAKKNEKALGENALRVIKLIFMVAFPCAIGMMLFSKEILFVLYNSSHHHTLLALSGVMILILPYIQTTTAMLQAIGKVWLPICATLFSVVLKAVLNVFFIKKWGIEGASLSTIAAFLPAFAVNSVLLFKNIKIKGTAKNLVKIVFCAALSCGAARFIYSKNETTVMLLVSIAAAALIYAAGIFSAGCITKEDLKTEAA